MRKLKNNKTQRLTERDRVIFHRCEVLREKQSDIAAEFGMSQSGISRLLRRVHDHLDGQLSIDVTRVRRIAEERFSAVFAEAWTAWKVSQRAAKTVSVTESTGGTGAESGGANCTRTRTSRNRDGSPKFLDVALSAASKILDLHGAWPEKKGGAPDVNTVNVQVVLGQLERLSDADLMRLASGQPAIPAEYERIPAALPTVVDVLPSPLAGPPPTPASQDASQQADAERAAGGQQT